jgi:hypothetical protein
MPLANSRLGSVLGRPDLIGVPRDPYGGTSNVLQAGVGLSGGLGATATEVQGRLTAGLLGALVIGVAAFYLWTRPLQA